MTLRMIAFAQDPRMLDMMASLSSNPVAVA